MLSDDQKKPGLGKPLGGAGLPGPLPGMKPGGLPGLGAKPGAGGLPGLGSGGLPGTGGGLPGMNPPGGGGLPGVKPGGGLPGMKPVGSASGLPGMRPSPSAAPPFVQQPESQPAPQPEPKPAVHQQDERDPFGQASAPVAATPSMAPAANDAMMMAAMNETSIEDAPLMNEKSRKTLIMALAIVAPIALLIGTLLGNGISSRRELNIAIRDALIVEYELKEAGKLFNNVQTVVSAALIKTNKREFDQEHLNFLKSNVPGNPLKPTILTDRNYKKFDPAAVQWLIDYYKKWDRLYGLIQEHRRSTEYDIKALKASRAQFQKLLQTNYGVVFKRDKQSKKFVGNVVLLGAGGKGNKIQVQVDSSTFASERELYNPEGEDSSLTKEPDKYVVELGAESKAGLLSNATQSHFKKYSRRLKEISDLMKGMAEIQQNLLNKISEICSQDPAALVDPDPEEELAQYIENAKSAPAE